MQSEENNKQLQEKMDKIIGYMAKSLYNYNDEERQAMIEHSVLSAFKTELKGNQLELLTNGLSNAVTEEIEKIKSYPYITGWVVREKPIEINVDGPKIIKNNRLVFFKDKPTRGKFGWLNGGAAMLSSPLFHDFFDMFSDLKWEDEPIKVTLPIIIEK